MSSKLPKFGLVVRFRLWISHVIYPHKDMERIFTEFDGWNISDQYTSDEGVKPSETNEYPMLVDTIKVLTDLNAERSQKMNPKARTIHNQAVIDGLARAKFLVESMDKWST